jgi:threonyl-tRNA synthetase
VQVDFNLPERFDVTYRGEDGKEQRAIMVHRALLGSVERFMGVLIEHFAGAFPTWLAPVQTKILTITDQQNDFATKAVQDLRDKGFRVEADLRNEKIGFKIREGTMEKVPYLAVIGKQEVETGTLAVRRRNGEDAGKLTLESFSELLEKDMLH